MNLLEILASGTLKVIGATNYEWDCFGPNAMYFDAGTDRYQHLVSVIFDNDDGIVYAIETFLPDQRQAWRWIDHRYSDDFLESCRHHGVNPRVAFDNVPFTNVESTEMLKILSQLTADPNLKFEEDEDDIA